MLDFADSTPRELIFDEFQPMLHMDGRHGRTDDFLVAILRYAHTCFAPCFAPRGSVMLFYLSVSTPMGGEYKIENTREMHKIHFEIHKVVNQLNKLLVSPLFNRPY